MPEYGEQLSKREQEILECVVDGSGNKQIAANLHISQNTVKVHLRNIYVKLGVSSRTEATTEAIRLGLVAIPGTEETAVIASTPPDTVAPPQTDGNHAEAINEMSHNGETAVLTATDPPTNIDATDTVSTIPQEKGRSKTVIILGFTLILLLLFSIVIGVNYFNNALPTPEPEPFVEEKLNDNWIKSNPLPITSAKAAIASFGLDLFLIGGEQNGAISNTVWLYDTSTFTWEEKAEKPTAVSDATATELGGIIFVLGGQTDNGEPTNIVEAYSPTNDAWGTVTSLPTAVSGGLALTDGSFIYFIGGTDGDNALNTMYVYDLGADNWRPLTNMSHARAYASGGVIGNLIYVVGGFDGQSELAVCEIYDIASDSWSDCSPMLTPRGGAGTAVIIKKLYTIGGGMNAKNNITYSEVYDPSVDEWSLINTPILDNNPQWTHLSVSSVENKIYTLGGIRADQQATNDNFAYAPLVYQTFIPAASSDSK